MKIKRLHKDRASWLSFDARRAQGLELLKRDPMFHRIPECDREFLVDDALAVGCQRCDALADRFRTRDPMEIARLLNVRIVFDISAYPRMPVTMLARYNAKPPSIIVYEQTLRRCREQLARHEIRTSSKLVSDLTALCVAHELFHHVERTEHCNVNLGYRLPVLDIGFLKIEKSPAMLSEIAAHAFTAQMFGLSFLPGALDSVLFVRPNQEREQNETRKPRRKSIANLTLEHGTTGN
jgi:hypothetical protein